MTEQKAVRIKLVGIAIVTTCAASIPWLLSYDGGYEAVVKAAGYAAIAIGLATPIAMLFALRNDPTGEPE